MLRENLAPSKAECRVREFFPFQIHLLNLSLRIKKPEEAADMTASLELLVKSSETP
jgi:hypothetical protein